MLHHVSLSPVFLTQRALCSVFALAYLDESNVGSLLTEALTADVEAVLADETSLVGADTAVRMSR